ncbi:hypothetical protein DWF00_02680 [Bosea caraganae]|uniref:Uncharacterized protein n=1 Tax=Bosea caraganae TaxID=2763117 RepID=A0A370L342_9HYPH|nr:hypothetical protein [Bosea caraganae]RDJ22500.1 hypothetical protein DWE98_18845 [Bosea caraganae]RDJ30459.1 hypothetical protein DWF00_02680 [Bosea caraganae]
MDEDRIKRIARAMCRAARLDPDTPAPDPQAPAIMRPQSDSRPPPAWTLFRQQAERFIAANPATASSL